MTSGGGPDAFTFVVVAHDLPTRIESICPYNDRVYVGLSDGSLVVLEPEFELEDIGPWKEERRLRGFGTKAITQLEPSPSLSALFSLSYNGIAMHSLPKLDPMGQVPVSGYPTRFAWNDKEKLLCVARKQLVFLKYQDGRFVEVNVVTIPDVVRVMAWCDKSLCYGSKTKYSFVDPETGQIIDSVAVRRGHPVLTPLQYGEILLTEDSHGRYARPTGHLARNVSINWTYPPQAVVLCPPFVVGLLDNSIEVRNVSPTARQCVIQMFTEVDRVNVASLFVGVDGSVFMASRERRTVCRLNPIPLRQQIEVLIEMKEFQDALQVVELLNDRDRTETEDDIRISYGINMFMNEEYNEGLMQFTMRSHRSPLLLLRLFPSLLPKEMMGEFVLPVSEEFFKDYKEPEGENYALAISCLLPLLLADRSRLASRKRDDLEKMVRESMEPIDEDAEVQDSETQDEGQGSMVIGAPTPSKLESRSRRNRLSVLVDTAILKAMLICPDYGALLQFVRNPNDIDLTEGERSLKPAGKYFELSALYQAHGQHDTGLEILRLLSLEPEKLEYPPKGAASDLRGITGVWAAVQYLSKLTEKDSQVIRKHSAWVLEQDPQAALEVFVGAEKRLPPSLVLPILAEHAPQYSAVYLEAILDQGDASREEHDMTLVSIYLREAIENEKKKGPLHKLADDAGRKFDFAKMNEKSTRRLLQKDAVFEASGEGLFDDVAKVKEKPEIASDLSPPTPLESYIRLRELLVESPYVDPGPVLESIPKDSLLELQALLLERQKNYLSALTVYIQRLKDLSLAEKLCDRVYEYDKEPKDDLETSQTFDISQRVDNLYMDMIRIYLEPENVTSNQIRHLTDDEWRNLSQLLCRKRYRINIEEMFDLLPGDVDIGVLMQFIEGALRTLAEQHRNLLIVHSLYTSENLHKKEQLIRCHQRVVPVTYESACCFCHKRIGNAVFVAYPNDSLAHIACYTRETKSSSDLPTRVSSGYRFWD